MTNEVIANMTNLADSGQDKFVTDWAEYARLTLYEMGVSHKFINSTAAAYILAKIVTDMIEDGNLSRTAEATIATLRVNHPHSEDKEV
jgi:hypothetical protein